MKHTVVLFAVLVFALSWWYWHENTASYIFLELLKKSNIPAKYFFLVKKNATYIQHCIILCVVVRSKISHRDNNAAISYILPYVPEVACCISYAVLQLINLQKLQKKKRCSLFRAFNRFFPEKRILLRQLANAKQRKMLYFITANFIANKGKSVHHVNHANSD